MDSDDDVGGYAGNGDAGNEGYSSKAFFEGDEKEKRQYQRKIDRKKDRKQSRIDGKAARIQAQKDWTDKLKNKRAQAEEDAREKKRAAGKAAFEAQMRKKGTHPEQLAAAAAAAKREAKKELAKSKGKKQLTSVVEEKPHKLSKKEKKQQLVQEKEGDIKTRGKRNRDGEDDVVASKKEAPVAAAKYVVPGRREKSKIKNVGVVSDIRVLLNKLSLENVLATSTSVADLFSMGAYSRMDVMTALCDELSKNCFQNTHLTSNSALTYAGLIRCIQVEHSNDAIAQIVEFTCAQLEDFVMADKRVPSVATALFLGHLFMVFCVDAALPITTLQWLLESAGEEDVPEGEVPSSVEAALALLRVVGPTLRQKVPVALNKVVHIVTQSETISRHRVLLELIKGIAQGKTGSTLVQQGMAGDQSVDSEKLNTIINTVVGESVKKANGTLPARAVRKAAETMAVLAVSWHHCTAVEKPPRWHTQQHDLFAEVEDTGRTLDNDDSEDDEEGEGDSDDEALDRTNEIKKLRTKDKALSGQRFGSEVKRAIFDCISESGDDQECFALLLRRDPRGKQVSEAAAVLIQCCVQEETYNPFYGLVLQRLLNASKKFKTHIQFSFWDRFKVLRFQAVDMTSYINLVNLVSYLMKVDSFSLPVLRGLDVQVDSRNVMLFARLLLLRLMVELPASRLAAVFFGGDVSGGEIQGSDINVSTTELRRAMKNLFKKYFTSQDEANAWIPAVFDVVAYGLNGEVNEDGSTGDPAIVARKKEALITALPSRIEMVRKALRDGM